MNAPIDLTQARALLLDSARAHRANNPLPIEQLPLEHALNRILAEDIDAAIDVPPAANSAMDGYALAAKAATAGQRLAVSQQIAAGSPPQPLAPGTAARILTGAEIPAGADAVIIQENCQREGEHIILQTAVRPGDNIRPQGQDISRGSRVFERGHRLTPADLGLLASINISRVPVFSQLSVSLLCTGNELVDPGRALKPGQIYNSNRFMLAALLARLGCVINRQSQVADTLEQTRDALQQAAEAQLILSSGGVSVGDADYVKQAVSELGALDLWKIAIKPGKPLAYGRVGTTPFIGLPGNPVSAFVTFVLLVAPFIEVLQGGQALPLVLLEAKAAFSRDKPGGRDEFMRGRLTSEGVVVHPQQSSGALSSVSWADCLVWVPAGCVVEHGQTVSVIPLARWQ